MEDRRRCLHGRLRQACRRRQLRHLRPPAGHGHQRFQEPATDFKDGKIVGTKRLYADGQFGTPDKKAKFMATAWRGLQAPGKQQEKDKFTFLINRGRANHVWQSIYLDQDNDFVMGRWPLPFLEINPDDAKQLGLNGDLVEVYNDNGSTQAMVQPTFG